MEKEIKDSGNRTQFESGAVRDIQEGKGRMDLLPLGVCAGVLKDMVFDMISSYRETGEELFLFDAVHHAMMEMFPGVNEYTVMMEVSKHFEAGAKKYGERNWEKGIPVSRYIDSALRHYCKAKTGWDDEPHERACIWNLICAIWTIRRKPELDDFSLKN